MFLVKQRMSKQKEGKKYVRNKINRQTDVQIDRKEDIRKNGSPLNPAFHLFNFHFKCQLLVSHFKRN